MRTFFGLGVEPEELQVIDALVTKRHARSRSDLARLVLAEEARRQGLTVPAGTLDERKPWDRRRTRVTGDQVATIKQLSTDGIRPVEIAQRVGLDRNTVAKIRSRSGLSVPRGTITKRGTT